MSASRVRDIRRFPCPYISYLLRTFPVSVDLFVSEAKRMMAANGDVLLMKCRVKRHCPQGPASPLNGPMLASQVPWETGVPYLTI